MPVIRIQTLGVSKVNKLLNRLPSAIKKEVGQKATLKIIQSAQRRIKYRYNVLGYGRGKLSTGYGLKSISIKKTPRGWSLSVADYLRLLDKRIRTHWVSMETIEAHQAHPGSTMFKKAPSTFSFTRPPVLFRWKGPFITPAIKALETDVPKILEKQINIAMQIAQS